MSGEVLFVRTPAIGVMESHFDATSTVVSLAAVAGIYLVLVVSALAGGVP